MRGVYLCSPICFKYPVNGLINSHVFFFFFEGVIILIRSFDRNHRGNSFLSLKPTGINRKHWIHSNRDLLCLLNYLLILVSVYNQRTYFGLFLGEI